MRAASVAIRRAVGVCAQRSPLMSVRAVSSDIPFHDILPHEFQVHHMDATPEVRYIALAIGFFGTER